MFRVFRLALCAAALALSTSACLIEDPGGGGGGPGHQTSGNSWTVLVYMVADNDLEPFALQDLDEMAYVGRSEDFRFVVQADRADAYTQDGVLNQLNWTSAKRLVVTNGGLEEVGDLGEVNMGDPNVLADFIEWGVRTYPADRYALIFWDHGGAWPGFGGDDSTAGHDLLNVAELKAGIENGLQRSGASRFALIGYDACLMATYEVALAMRPFGEYLLASEELEPGHGWDWQSWAIARDVPSSDPVAVGRSIIDGFLQQATAQQTSATVTLSLTDLYALGDLEAGVDALAREAQSGLDTSMTLLARQRGATLAFNRTPDETQSSHMLDIGDLAAKLAEGDGRFAAAKQQIDEGLQKAIVYKTAGPVTQSATGLSIYFPPYAALYKGDYDDLAEVANWRTFLKAYYGDGTQAGPAPRFVSQVATASVDQGTFYVEGQLQSGANNTIASAELLYGFRDTAGNIFILGDAPASWDANYAWGQWDLSVLTLTQGTNVGYGYLSIQNAANNNFAAIIPLAYQEAQGADEQYAIREIIFDGAGNVVQDLYYLVTNAGVGELAPVTGSTFTPLVQQVDTAGNASWVYGGTAMDASQPLTLGFQYLASGVQAFGAVTISNAAAQGDIASGLATVP